MPRRTVGHPGDLARPARPLCPSARDAQESGRRRRRPYPQAAHGWILPPGGVVREAIAGPGQAPLEPGGARGVSGEDVIATTGRPHAKETDSARAGRTGDVRSGATRLRGAGAWAPLSPAARRPAAGRRRRAGACGARRDDWNGDAPPAARRAAAGGVLSAAPPLPRGEAARLSR